MKKQLRLGGIGFGRAGYGMHLKELEGKEEMFTYSAVCDIDPERLGWMKEKYPECKTYSCAEDLVEDPDVDVVIVSTRSCDHFKHAKTALEAGKIVFLEKPMSVNYEEAKLLMELGEKTGERKLFIRHNRRFEARFMQVNKIIESGILGDVYLIRRNQDGFDYRRDWQTLSQYGGGQLLNWGPHIIDQSLRFCGGDYKRMYSDIKQVICAGDCEDFVRVIFEGINGRTVEMEISGATALPQPDYVVYGTRGALVSNGKTFTLKYLPEDFQAEGVVASTKTPEGAKFGKAIETPFVTEEIEWEDNPLDHTWTYLYEAICEGKDYPIKSEEALKVMEVISAIKEQNK
ncbi:MAG: Gfo/Idh/MocA family oxidoreductase [Clostridia bacterium]|nr:Gfo/Idh/MocA family oxidoreductase [Clostridia bacterium]